MYNNFGYSNQTYSGAQSPFNSFGNGFINTQPQTPVQATPQSSGSFMAVFVNGEDEVEKYPVAAGLTVMLIDFNLKKFWLKSTSINGVPEPLRVFPFAEEKTDANIQNGQAVSREEFEGLSAKLDKLIAELGGAK